MATIIISRRAPRNYIVMIPARGSNTFLDARFMIHAHTHQGSWLLAAADGIYICTCARYLSRPETGSARMRENKILRDRFRKLYATRGSLTARRVRVGCSDLAHFCHPHL